MKHTVLFFLIISCCYAIPVWESTGPYGAPLRDLALAPLNENIIYVVSYEYSVPNTIPRVFKSTDDGDSWEERGVITDSIPLHAYCLAVDAEDPDVVYAGGSKRVYKSTDGGATWTEDSLSIDSIPDIATHPTVRSTVFAVGRVKIGGGPPIKRVMGFFKSTDGGENWVSVALDTLAGFSHCIVLNHSNPNVIYVGGITANAAKVFKSTDGGESFTDISSNLPPDTARSVVSLAVHPSDSNIVYAGISGYIDTDPYYAIYRTTDGGGSWVETRVCTLIFSLATTPADSSVVYAGLGTDFLWGSDGRIHKSTDAGVSWFETDPTFYGYRTSGLAAKSTDASIAYAANSGDFFRTTNGGTNWLPSNHGITYGRIRSFGIAPSSPSTIYTNFDPQGVYKTTNSGSSWTRLPEFGEVCGQLCAIAVDETDPDVVVCFKYGEV